MKKRIIFILPFFISVFGVFKFSSDPFLFKNRAILFWFENFKFGNETLLNISIGMMISYLFYYIVIYIPEKREKKVLDILIKIELEKMLKLYSSIYIFLNLNFDENKKINLTNLINEKWEEKCLEIRLKKDKLLGRSPVEVAVIRNFLKGKEIIESLLNIKDHQGMGKLHDHYKNEIFKNTLGKNTKIFYVNVYELMRYYNKNFKNNKELEPFDIWFNEKYINNEFSII